MDLNKILKIVLIIAVVLIAGSIFYHYVVFLPKKEQTQIEQQKQGEQAKKEQQEQEAQKEALKAQKEQEFQAWVNDCIVKAQNEKDRRQRLVSSAWADCLGTIVGSTECNRMKDSAESDIEGYYKQWEANCKIGIANNF